MFNKLGNDSRSTVNEYRRMLEVEILGLNPAMRKPLSKKASLGFFRKGENMEFLIFSNPKKKKNIIFANRSKLQIILPELTSQVSKYGYIPYTQEFMLIPDEIKEISIDIKKIKNY